MKERLTARLLRAQNRIAAYLNRKTQHWNKTSKLIALTLFIVVFGGASMYLIIKSI